MSLLKATILRLNKVAGLNAAARFATSHNFRILAYHGVDEQNDPIVNFDGFQITPAVFRQQLEVLARYFHVVPLMDALKNPLKNAVALTFDDGYQNNLTTVAPLLMEFGMPATFFVTTGFIDGAHQPWWYVLRSAIARAQSPVIDIVGEPQIPIYTVDEKRQAIHVLEKRLRSLPLEERDQIIKSVVRLSCATSFENPYPMMTWNDVRNLMHMGFKIGAHTVRHTSLANESHETAKLDVWDSIERIKVETNVRPVSFAYPYGTSRHFNQDVVEILKSSGLATALTTVNGSNRAGDDKFTLKRLNVTNGYDALSFERLLSFSR